MVLESRSPEETETIGRRLGAIVGPGDVVYLIGPLGAGKTTLVRGLHQGMACGGRVRSPSFTTLIEYSGPIPLYHFDLYRYETAGAGFLDEFAEWLEGTGVAVVEWADRLEAGDVFDHLEVRFDERDGDDSDDSAAGRRITLTAVAGEWADRLGRLDVGRGLGASPGVNPDSNHEGR